MSDQTESSTTPGWLERQVRNYFPVLNATLQPGQGPSGNAVTTQAPSKSTTSGLDWSALAQRATSSINDSYDSWDEVRRAQSEAEQQKRQYDALRQYVEQQQRIAEATKRRLSKRELMAGALKEMTAIRERLDQLTAIITTEALTGDEEPEQDKSAGAGYVNYNPSASLAGQPITASSINQLIDAKLGLI